MPSDVIFLSRLLKGLRGSPTDQAPAYLSAWEIWQSLTADERKAVRLQLAAG